VKGKLERCPFCGKWSVLKSLPNDMLLKAEQNELNVEIESNQNLSFNEEDLLRKEIEESRFQDL
jgi:hypothetical protein